VLRWLALTIAVLIFVGAYSHWFVMPGLPPLLFPVLAVVGAGFVAWSFANSLVRFLRRTPGDRRPHVLLLVVNASAVVLLVIVPLTRFLGMVAPAKAGEPRILSSYGDWLGAEGYPRVNGRHIGADIAGGNGSPVLAPADGRVIVAREGRDSCGSIIVIEHEVDGYRTIYCYLSAILVKRGDDVKRGARIGAIGTTGMRAWPGYEHLHWELQKGRGGPYEDPISRTIGCFKDTERYPADRFVLTYPVPC